MDIKTVPLRVKTGPEDGLKEGEFLVYPSTFIRKADSYGDVVAPGAFMDDIKAWKESGDVLPGLYGHRLDDPDYFVAGATDMGEDEHGWWVRGEFDLESPKGPQVYRLVKGKRLRQLSFAYDVLDEGSVELDDGTKVNELRRLKVYEFSFVPVGANQDTSVVAVKALREQVATHVEAVKAGRVFSAKNERALRQIGENASGIADDIKSLLSAMGGEEEDDQEKANGNGPAKDEEPQRVKSEELSRGPSAKTLAAEMALLALMGEGEGGSL